MEGEDARKVLQKSLGKLIYDKGWSYRKLSAVSGVSIGTISNILRGKSMPAADIALRLAISLDTSVESLMLGEDNSIDRSLQDLISEFDEIATTPADKRMFISRQNFLEWRDDLKKIKETLCKGLKQLDTLDVEGEVK